MIQLSIVAVAVQFFALLLSTTSAPFQDEVADETTAPYAQAVQSLARLGFRPAADQPSLFVGDSQVEDSTLGQIPDLPFSFGLYLSGQGVTNEGLKTLQSLSNLTVLHLVNTSVDGEFADDFRLKVTLNELVLLNSPVTDAGLRCFCELRHLRTVDLRRTKVIGPGLLELAPLKQLESIEVDLTVDHLRALKTASLLHTLPYAEGADGQYAKTDDAISVMNLNGFYGIEVTDAAINEVSHLPCLHTLNLIGSDITDSGLPNLANLKCLRSLSLEQTRITDAGLKHLSKIKCLTSLSLDKTEVTDDGLIHLGGCSKLTTLDLNRTGITDRGIKTLSGFRQLRSLNLASTLVMLNEASGIENLKDLETLGLSGSKVNDQGLAHIAMLTNLKLLDLILCPISDDGLKELRNLKSLETLYLNHTQITDAGLKTVSQLPNLSILSLNATRVTDVGISELHVLAKLKALTLFGTFVTDEAVQSLRASLTQCEIRR